MGQDLNQKETIIKFMIFGDRRKEVRTEALSRPDNPSNCIGCWAFIEKFGICNLALVMGGITLVEYNNSFTRALEEADEKPMPETCPNGFQSLDHVKMNIEMIIP